MPLRSNGAQPRMERSFCRIKKGMIRLSSPLPIRLRWLGDRSPEEAAGVTWGVPWKKGQLQRHDLLQIAGESGSLPVQSWPTAYWPDGSVKWSAHAAVTPGGAPEELLLGKAAGREGAAAEAEGVCIKVEESGEAITVDTGLIRCVLPKTGRQIIHSITRGSEELCSGGELTAVRSWSTNLDGVRTVREEPFNGKLYRVSVEQKGPVRAVVRMEGRCLLLRGSREWLPFTLRLYFYAGLDSIRMVHTFLYDGNPHEDAVAGLGLAFSIPVRGPLYNRHVRLSGGAGFFCDSPKSIYNLRTTGKYRELYIRQQDGEQVVFDSGEDARFLGLMEDAATWDSFKLVQDSPDRYTVKKRTEEGCSWVKAAEGRRAGGLAYAGSESGGLAVGLRGFWRKAPSALEVSGISGHTAKLQAWLWPRDAEPMDLRHYDTKTHVESSYEGAKEMRATPYGIANTNELTLWALARTPGPDALRGLEQAAEAPPLLVCSPDYYHEAGAFGIWSLPDRSTPAKALLEERLDGIVDFYLKEVETRRWYGFWDYGDFMHSYDSVRHVWNYDLGGCAWQNTELAPNMWLWIMFLRSGREDLFRLAEAMTRHTSEVDVYHIGEYAGLGSRHNVVHWGCGCKEARIAMAGLHRYYYYLTADERLGDIMDEVKDSDYTTVTLPPMRAYYPKDEHPTHVRVGPDWAAFSSNWMTRWERHEDHTYRDKLLTGIGCLKQADYRLISGPVYGYDPASGKLTPMGNDNWGRHLAICMGGPQVWFELAGMLEDPEWNDMMAELGVYYNAPQEEKDLLTKGEVSHKRFEHPVLSVSIAAYGAYHRKDRTTAERCWTILHGNPYGKVNLQSEAQERVYTEPLQEIGWINTNEAAQWSLNTIISLELIGAYLPEA